MDFRQLRCFLAVAETLHFRKAAQRLRMSQPPLSATIKALEEDLGVQLLERSTRRVALTEAGVTLRRKGEVLLADLEKVIEETRRVGQGLAGRLSVGFVGIAMNLGLPAVLKRFRQQYPEVEIVLEELPSHALYQKLAEGKLDLAFARTLAGPPKDFHAQLFARENYHLALPESSPLCERKTIRLTHLDDQDLLFFPRQFHPKIHDAWMHAFHQAEIQPRLVQEARSLQTELSLVSAGIGAALVTASVAKEAREGIEFRPLRGNQLPKVNVYALWHPERSSEAMSRFISCIL